MSIVLLMGIPAAGKTTLARELLSSISKSSLFSFDTMFGREIEDLNAHKIRKKFEETIKAKLEEIPNNEWHLILADDIFYLKSMRRPFKRMARALGFQFIVVALQCDLSTALERNRLREKEKVSEETIRRIYNEMEFSSNCYFYKSLPELLEIIKETKRVEPIIMRKEESLEQTQLKNNEITLRKCVKLLVDEGYNGKALAAAKKTVWKNSKYSEKILEEEEGKMLLLTHL